MWDKGKGSEWKDVVISQKDETTAVMETKFREVNWSQRLFRRNKELGKGVKKTKKYNETLATSSTGTR